MGVRSGQVTAGHSLPVPTEQTPLFVFLFVTFHFPNRDFFVAKRTIKDLKGKFYIPEHVTIAAGQRKVKVFGFLRFGVYSPFDALYGQRLVALRAEMLFSVHVDRAFEHPLLLLHLTTKPFLCNEILKFCERARPKPISASAAPRRQRPVRGGEGAYRDPAIQAGLYSRNRTVPCLYYASQDTANVNGTATVRRIKIKYTIALETGFNSSCLRKNRKSQIGITNISNIMSLLFWF